MLTERQRLDGSWRDRTVGRVSASPTGDPRVAWAGVVAMVAGVWAVSHLAGGSQTALPHLFYVPIVVAALRFGGRPALAVALAAGIAAGPLLPLDLDAGTSQDTVNWLVRLAAFVSIGQLTAYLSRHSLPSVTGRLAAHRFRAELEEAIGTGQVRVAYQPIVDLDSGDVAGVEALVRWDHPERGPVPPNEFVPEAERTGCVDLITEFVISEVCREVAEWHRGPLAGRASFTVSVNVSALDLADTSLRDHVAATLERTGLPSHWLHLEVTETALVVDVDLAADALVGLRLLGIRLAIDDFGTGESSLAILHRFPVDAVKVDRLFVQHLDHHERVTTLASGIIALAHAMHLVTVAEGIETPLQAGAVRSFGCRLGQGFLFSPALPPGELRAILDEPDPFRTANLAHLHTPDHG